jgi:hypothetical protein
VIRLALALLLLFATLHVTGLSSAAFTDEEVEAPSAFTGGTLDIAVDAAASTPLDASNMRPGLTRSATFALKNAGNVPAALAVAAQNVVDTPASAGLSAVLELKVEDCGLTPTCTAPVTAYTGSVRDFAGAQLGQVAAGATRRARVTLTWGADKDDPARQGASTAATLVWRAVAGTSKP